MDRLLDQADTGPFYLRQPEIAEIVIGAIHYNAVTLGHYAWHAYVVMPNHVHLLITPAVPIPRLMKSLKGITAKRANVILGLTGSRFWQEESYDHLIRNEQEFRTTRSYIEENPVRAGLALNAAELPLSGANARPGGRLRTMGSALHSGLF